MILTPELRSWALLTVIFFWLAPVPSVNQRRPISFVKRWPSTLVKWWAGPFCAFYCCQLFAVSSPILTWTSSSHVSLLLFPVWTEQVRVLACQESQTPASLPPTSFLTCSAVQISQPLRYSELFEISEGIQNLKRKDMARSLSQTMVSLWYWASLGDVSLGLSVFLFTTGVLVPTPKSYFGRKVHWGWNTL